MAAYKANFSHLKPNSNLFEISMVVTRQQYRKHRRNEDEGSNESKQKTPEPLTWGILPVIAIQKI